MTYRRIASVEEYVLLAQDDHKVIVHRRAEKWRAVVLRSGGYGGVSVDRAFGPAGADL
jgi:hypothetical protein